jgi:hypothetical protein
VVGMKIVIVYSKRHGTINVYVHLEEIIGILKKYNFEQGDEGDEGVLWWFGYPEDIDLSKLIDDLRRVAIVEYVEEQ